MQIEVLDRLYIGGMGLEGGIGGMAVYWVLLDYNSVG